MTSSSRGLWVALFVSLAACTASPDLASPPTAIGPGTATIAPSPTGATPTQVPVVTPPSVADLSFPPPRDLPIIAPETPTPEAFIEAFLRLVHDPELTYHVDGMTRWVIDGTETMGARSVVHDGEDRHLVIEDPSGLRGEAIVRGASAAVRQGAGAWQAEDADLLRLFDDLSKAVVIGDLGPEPEVGRYRLVIDGKFDSSPPFRGSGDFHKVTEVVIDEAGLPINLRFHEWTGPLGATATVEVEGIAVFTFDRVGERVTIPALPVEPVDERSPTPSATPLMATAMPGGGLTIDMPRSGRTSTGRLTFGTDAGHQTGLDVEYLTADAPNGGRFEVGSTRVPADALEGLTPVERLRAVRYAVPSRLPGGDVLGYRSVDIDGVVGQEVVADGYNEQLRGILYRIRTVLIDDRLVILTVGGPEATVGSAEADRFLDSLRPASP